MESILKDILKELQWQTRLMEKLYHAKDENQNIGQHINKNVNDLMAKIMEMPGMQTPQAKDLIKSLMNIVPGGKL